MTCLNQLCGWKKLNHCVGGSDETGSVLSCVCALSAERERDSASAHIHNNIIVWVVVVYILLYYYIILLYYYVESTTYTCKYTFTGDSIKPFEVVRSTVRPHTAAGVYLNKAYIGKFTGTAYACTCIDSSTRVIFEEHI